MYFSEVSLFEVERFVSNLDNLYAHSKESHKEKLKEHMDLTYNYFIKLCKVKNLDPIFKSFEEKFLQGEDLETIALWKDILGNAVYMHDIGKINSDFQFLVMNNEKYKGTPQIDSNHSMLSGCIYFNHYFNKIKDIKGKDAKNILLQFLTLNSYIISKHHGSLDDFILFRDRFLGKYKFYIENKNLYLDCKIEFDIKTKNIEPIFKMVHNTLENFEKAERWRCVDVYIYSRLLFSLLTGADFYATSDYQNGRKIDDFGVIENTDRFYNIFREGKIYKNIEMYREFLEESGINPFKEKDINQLRTEMFLEAENNLIKHIDKNIFYLEAPTGSGKTNTSVNLAFKLLERNKELNKLFYIFPFNTLVEQTKKSLCDIFSGSEILNREIAVINSITPIFTEDKLEDNKSIDDKELDNSIDYEKALLDRQFLHYPIVLTTHVNFFSYLFANSREAVFPLSYIANSVVILDEIQSYRNNVWKEVIIFLKKYSEILNIKIIIMSATLPRLEKLIGSNESFVQLIEDRSKYFENPLFKDRVELDFSLLDIEEEVREELLNKVIETSRLPDKNILVEFIKKATAVEFYKDLIEVKERENLNKKILLITGDDNRAERNRIIDIVKSEKDIILVATQVIEAGVDIDMDIGFKDISILDSEEQFLGRINRSCKKTGSKVYFFNLDEATLIYKGDYRKEKSITLRNELMREILKNKNFSNFYSIVMERIDKDLNKENSRNIDEFRKEAILNLRYEDIRERMKLIDDDRKEYTIFLNRDIEIEEGKILNGSEVWDEYHDILADKSLGYAERKVKLSRVLEKMDYFTYKVNKISSSYKEAIGDIFFIENGEKYLIDGKFDREKFNESSSYEIIEF